MRARAILGVTVAVLLMLPVAATARPGNGGRPVYQVSGGGQVLFDSDSPTQGAANTIGFTAQLLEDGTTARGQFQWIDRSSGTGQSQQRTHGVVTCVVPGGFEADDSGNPTGDNVARFGGVLRDDPDTAFVVDVTDNGQPSDGGDLIFVQVGNVEPDAPCEHEREEDDESDFLLARGNVKIHDRRPPS